MKFVCTDELVKGMRIARPIYNQNGVLLYDRGSKLTKQGISSIKNFKLFGIYILEPVEPIPPMTDDDIEFERFQTMNVYAIRENWEMAKMSKKLLGLDMMAEDIQKIYSNSRKKIDFTQTLRSEEDEAYKHTLNSTILATLMAARLRISESEQLNLIRASLLYDIGRDMGGVRRRPFESDFNYFLRAHEEGSKLIMNNDKIDEEVREIVVGRYRLEAGMQRLGESIASVKILQAAQDFDNYIAAKIGENPLSDVTAIRKMLAASDKYGVEILSALIDSIKILRPGICVQLTDKRAGLVIRANNKNVLRPIILIFEDNSVCDLTDDNTFAKVQIADIMKTLDKRIIIDPKIISEFMSRYAE
ncbi:MAG: hypothetical protein E7266_09675 [Lachnospiraceae bacterium]|nr:hypothetical protein [Lachnospiraceae bacterium]